MNDFDLEGRRALVTGAAGAIGAAATFALARAGADVVAADRREAQLAACLAESRARGLDVRVESVDVSEPESVCRLVEATIGRLKGLDILVNAAALQLRKLALDITVEEWQEVIDTNLRGTFLVCQASCPHLKGGGAIINLASVTCEHAIEQIAVYGASKAAVAQLTRQLALEWARDGIRVNAVAPGYVQTEMTAEVLRDRRRRQELLRRIPLGRFGEPNDIGGPIVFLASDAARYITGHVLFADGGWAAC